MIVMWSSPVNTTSWVEYRSISDQISYKSYSTVRQLTVDAYNALPFIHKAVLQNLEEGSEYRYYISTRCLNRNIISSNQYNFTTIKTQYVSPMSVLVYGDMGARVGLETISKLQEEIETSKYTCIWHIGDLAYDLYTDGGAIGDQFMREIQNLSAYLPYMTSPGNHELHGDFLHYATRFSTPNTRWPIPLEQMYYSYDIGLVHFISYSTEVYFIHDQNFVCDQYNWLLQDLIRANQNRSKRPWIVAMGHRPMYCSNTNSDDCTGSFMRGWVRYGLEDLFYSQGVDLILQGHEHSYERSWPMYKRQPINLDYNNPRAPVHVISGAGGCNEGRDKEPRMGESWSAFIDNSKTHDNSYGKLHVHNTSHLHWQQIAVTSGQVLDSIWLVQRAHGPFDTSVDCDLNRHGSHKVCRCPMVFHFETCIIASSVVLIVIVVTIVTLCCYCKFKKRKTNLKKEYMLAKQEADYLDDDLENLIV
ncbi:acid phosphatase type 7 [Patella vulgata]|uniref:acid phosphatase type 7 n=1 Tax=Patella vulgata TaxID=6465 RepID=UPI0024A864F5|nr:acid phosphatase type 7 [Patella vulgata]